MQRPRGRDAGALVGTLAAELGMSGERGERVLGEQEWCGPLMLDAPDV